MVSCFELGKLVSCSENHVGSAHIYIATAVSLEENGTTIGEYLSFAHLCGHDLASTDTS